MESYKELILRKDIKNSYLHLPRTNKRVEMIRKGFKIRKMNENENFKLDGSLKELGIVEPGESNSNSTSQK